jgi:glyoxalase family protein
MQPISGIHHITAIASDPQRNLDFYTQALGLRLVKLTVNFDDPGAYHFYFGDAAGRPGSVLTFFPWPNARRGRRGTGQVGTIAFAIPPRSTGFWQERCKSLGVTTSSPFQRFDETVLSLLDPDGLHVELVEQPGASAEPAWPGGPVGEKHAIRGFAGPTVLLGAFEETAALLTDKLGLRQVGQHGPRYRFSAPAGGPGSLIDLEARPNEQAGRMGAGIVHHLAWRAADDENQLAWRETLIGLGFNVTPLLDRQYFHSIYFREPAGVLFEIATDPPGFTLDEPLEALGSGLRLPPWLEPRRKMIEDGLPRLRLPHEQPAG